MAASREDGGHVMREHGHEERGFRRSMREHRNHESPASLGAGKGGGEQPGAGELELPGNGPGKAASRYVGMPEDVYNSRKTPGVPSGISTYREGDAPPRGYRE